MNQILCIDNDKRCEVNSGIKPVIRFFVIVIILFALIFIGQGVYSIVYNNKENMGLTGTPKLSLEQQGSTILVTVEYARGIDKIIYSWGNGDETEIKSVGKTRVQESIDLPLGTNSLNISIVDVYGKVNKYEKQDFTYNSIGDSIKPQIEVAKGSAAGKVKISIKDENSLKSVIYYWDSEEQIQIEFEQDSKIVETEILAKEGERYLTIIATDSSDNIQTVTKTIRGSKKPEISVKRDGNHLIIRLFDDDGIQKIEYNFNGTDYTTNDINQKEHEFKLDLQSGQNYISITAYDVNGLTATYKGKSEI